MKSRLCLLTIASLLALSGLFNPSLSARASVTTLMVNTAKDIYNEADTLSCSLREAIVAANENRVVGGCPAGSSSTMDSIFVPVGDYYLSIQGAGETAGKTGDLNITQSVTITGAATEGTRIIGESSFGVKLLDRIFHVKNASEVLIRNMTLKSADAVGADLNGTGGAILNEKSSLTIENCILDGNKAVASGGGIFNASGATLTVNGSTFKNNTADYGGAILNAGTTIMTGSLVTSNNATKNGGGIANNAYLTGEKFVLINVTITSNTANANLGGGIYSDAQIEITNTTIDQNHSGGGMYIAGSGFIKNSIIAGHGDNRNCSFNSNGDITFTSAGYNIEDANDCELTATGDRNETDPELAPSLSNAGGPTQLFALLPGSLAINHGSNTNCPTDDQRGVLYRRTDGLCDIGAFEFGVNIYPQLLPLVSR